MYVEAILDFIFKMRSKFEWAFLSGGRNYRYGMKGRSKRRGAGRCDARCLKQIAVP